MAGRPLNVILLTTLCTITISLVTIKIYDAYRHTVLENTPTTFELWARRHALAKSSAPFPLAPDGRYKVEVGQQNILLPTVEACHDCMIRCWLLENDGSSHYEILNYTDVLGSPRVARALMSDALSINFRFNNNPSSGKKFLGLYPAQTVPYLEHLDVSIDVAKTALFWPRISPNFLQQLNTMALGKPPFDKDGFSKIKQLSFEGSNRVATLLVAPRNESTDAYGEPLFFLCDESTCLQSKTDTFSIGAFRSSEGFHLFKNVRFSAQTAGLSEESLKPSFDFVLHIVSEMIRN